MLAGCLRRLEDYGRRREQRVNVDEVIVRGNTYTDREVVLRKADVESGDPFSYTAMLEAQRELYRLGIFQRVDVQPHDQHPEILIIAIEYTIRATYDERSLVVPFYTIQYLTWALMAVLGLLAAGCDTLNSTFFGAPEEALWAVGARQAQAPLGEPGAQAAGSAWIGIPARRCIRHGSSACRGSASGRCADRSAS